MGHPWCDHDCNHRCNHRCSHRCSHRRYHYWNHRCCNHRTETDVDLSFAKPANPLHSEVICRTGRRGAVTLCRARRRRGPVKPPLGNLRGAGRMWPRVDGPQAGRAAQLSSAAQPTGLDPTLDLRRLPGRPGRGPKNSGPSPVRGFSVQSRRGGRWGEPQLFRNEEWAELTRARRREWVLQPPARQSG